MFYLLVCKSTKLYKVTQKDLSCLFQGSSVDFRLDHSTSKEGCNLEHLG